ncbi:far upstream element-binding protein 2-like isoform X2 [Abrus precatorius]|uniref:Far upstream element-binding protein 2-like isoform X2 n=1 Tax=Abrus precatorius TaxID=3816 RepID=A0A8B8LM72_ABRPR|nr:far upstream element-binding protein 2-like isoform X2 [Abrus precatorius]
MAEEAQYSSGTDSAPLKRKYEDQSTHRPTGFSAPLSPPSPATGIELAKQRAQEVAARLLSGAPPLDAKRPKPDNGAPPTGFDSLDAKPQYSAPSAAPVSYGHQGTSKKIDIPNGRVGVIIGKGGDTIKYLQLQSGAKIQVTRDMDADPNSSTRMVELMGTPEAIASAEKLINEVLAEAEAGGSGIVARRLTGQAGSDEFVMKIPNNKVIPLHLPPGDTSTERTVKIDGTPEQIESAKQLVNQVISGENRLRNPAMSGGYPQQGYQSRPPSNWAPPVAPMQQPGYGYVQPGAYTGPSPQYNMPQPPYTGYPPQQSGGYSTSWDQSTAAPHQQSTHSGGYDYYSQQAQQPQNPGGPAPSADGSTYNYSQQPSSGYNQQGQGYAQDGYNGYNAPSQSGYGQPPSYDQQQGYGSATGYGSGSNPAQEGHTANYASQGDSAQAPSVPPSTIAQQGYPTSQQPSSNNANYPPQGTPQSGYGIPPTSQAAYGNQPQSGYGSGYGPPQSQKPAGNPPVYGQSQSPSTAGGYGQSAYPAQPPPSGYAQLESGPQRAPPSGFGGAVQPGYGPQSYGTPQGGQPGYGQAPPPYGNNSYGAGYTQTPAYTSDSNAGGNSRGSYDGAPAPAVQQSGVAKASPQS